MRRIVILGPPGSGKSTLAQRPGARLALPLARILRRIAASHGLQRPDMAEGCREQLDLAFLGYALVWNRKRRARSLALVEGFPGRRIVVRGRQDFEAVAQG